MTTMYDDHDPLKISRERLKAEMRRLGYEIGQMTLPVAFDRIAEAMEGQRKRIEDLERQVATEREIAASHVRKESEA